MKIIILINIIFIHHCFSLKNGAVESESLEKDDLDFLRNNEVPYKVICYYGAWSVYRRAPMNFGIRDVDPFACTHLIYSFAGLRNNKIVSLDPGLDIEKGFYKSAVNLKSKNPKLKVMIAIGGWNEGARTYSNMVSSETTRKAFIKSVIEFLELHGFDGLDLDWEYPGATDRGGKYSDKENFSLLVEELSKEFVKRKWILSMAVGAAKSRIDAGYQINRLAKNLDFINIMTYDFHGSWDKFVDHHSPLKSRTHDKGAYKDFNSDFALSYWEKNGAPPRKLILGIPFYARTFTLADSRNTKPGSPARGPGKLGKYTQESGFNSYYEVCLAAGNGTDNGWTKAADSDGNPYIYKDNQWMSYDDIDSIDRKMNYVKSRGLGGAMVWAVDLDDYKGICGGSRWPLLSTINHILRPHGTAETGDNDGQKTTTTMKSTKKSTTTKKISISTSAPSGSGSNFVCPGPGIYPSPKRCDQFLSCSPSGDIHVFTCQSGLLFDEKLMVCNWPDSVSCAPGTQSK